MNQTPRVEASGEGCRLTVLLLLEDLLDATIGLLVPINALRNAVRGAEGLDK